MPTTPNIVRVQRQTPAPAPEKRRTATQPLEVIDHDDALLIAATVSALVGLSGSSLYRLEKTGELVPVRLGKRCTRWRALDVRRWLAAQATGSVR